MARMIPTHGPRTVRAADRRHRMVYDRLSSGLSADHVVVHDPRWVASDARSADLAARGQADFLVAHPEQGLLLLYVHGGGLRHEPHGDRWTAMDADGQQRHIADPLTVGDAGLDALLSALRRHIGAEPSLPMVGWAVVMPDVQAPTSGVSSGLPRELIVDRGDLRDPTRRFDALAAWWQRQRPASGNAASRWWWRAFESLFVAPREVRVLLRDRVEDDRERMISLSDQQVAVLDMLARRRRQTIYGPAGTGKTVLAIEKARALAAQGMRVLLTCYNRALGHHLREATRDEPHITALHFHELCFEVGRFEARGLTPPADPAGRDVWFKETLPDEMLAWLAEHPVHYDALVVDEAQDFLPRWWTVLDAFTEEPGEAIRYLFYDDAQRLQENAAPVPGADEAVVLRTNWRNTRAIHEHLGGVEPTVRKTPCAAPAGLPVEHETLAPTPGRALKRVLQRLLERGALRLDDVVLLSGRSAAKSRWAQPMADLAPWRTTTGNEPGCLRIRSIQSYKGLESPVVILSELDAYEPARARRLAYVGASRAMNHLVVLGDAEVEDGPW